MEDLALGLRPQAPFDESAGLAFGTPPGRLTFGRRSQLTVDDHQVTIRQRRADSVADRADRAPPAGPRAAVAAPARANNGRESGGPATTSRTPISSQR